MTSETDCAGEPETPALQALYERWQNAFAARDVEAVLQLLTADHVLWAAGAPPIGREALRPRLAAAFSSFEIESTFEREECVIVADLAFERGWDVQRIRSLSDGRIVLNRQRVFLISRRDPDGVWRFARGMSQPGPPADS